MKLKLKISLAVIISLVTVAIVALSQTKGLFQSGRSDLVRKSLDAQSKLVTLTISDQLNLLFSVLEISSLKDEAVLAPSVNFFSVINFDDLSTPSTVWIHKKSFQFEKEFIDQAVDQMALAPKKEGVSILSVQSPQGLKYYAIAKATKYFAQGQIKEAALFALVDGQWLNRVLASYKNTSLGFSVIGRSAEIYDESTPRIEVIESAVINSAITEASQSGESFLEFESSNEKIFAMVTPLTVSGLFLVATAPESVVPTGGWNLPVQLLLVVLGVGVLCLIFTNVFLIEARKQEAFIIESLRSIDKGEVIPNVPEKVSIPDFIINSLNKAALSIVQKNKNSGVISTKEGAAATVAQATAPSNKKTLEDEAMNTFETMIIQSIQDSIVGVLGYSQLIKDEIDPMKRIGQVAYLEEELRLGKDKVDSLLKSRTESDTQTTLVPILINALLSSLSMETSVIFKWLDLDTKKVKVLGSEKRLERALLCLAKAFEKLGVTEVVVELRPDTDRVGFVFRAGLGQDSVFSTHFWEKLDISEIGTQPWAKDLLLMRALVSQQHGYSDLAFNTKNEFTLGVYFLLDEIIDDSKQSLRPNQVAEVVEPPPVAVKTGGGSGQFHGDSLMALMPDIEDEGAEDPTAIRDMRNDLAQLKKAEKQEKDIEEFQIKKLTESEIASEFEPEVETEDDLEENTAPAIPLDPIATKVQNSSFQKSASPSVSDVTRIPPESLATKSILEEHASKDSGDFPPVPIDEDSGLFRETKAFSLDELLAMDDIPARSKEESTAIHSIEEMESSYNTNLQGLSTFKDSPSEPQSQKPSENKDNNFKDLLANENDIGKDFTVKVSRPKIKN